MGAITWGRDLDVLAGFAGTGRVLEFAVGTGREALPPSSRGLEVHGIELAPHPTIPR